MSGHLQRRLGQMLTCNGGPTLWCGDGATVVCTGAAGEQWFACDDIEHQADPHEVDADRQATTEPLDEFLERVSVRSTRSRDLVSPSLRRAGQ